MSTPLIKPLLGNVAGQIGGQGFIRYAVDVDFAEAVLNQVFHEVFLDGMKTDGKIGGQRGLPVVHRPGDKCLREGHCEHHADKRCMRISLPA